MQKELLTKIENLFEKMGQKNLTLSSCESYTGGAFANAITNVEGSSNFFKGALVTYSNSAKTKLAHVNKRIIKKYGAVSQECAEAMASGVRKSLDTNIGISFTGNADKDVMEDKAPFSGYITIDFQGIIKSYKLDLSQQKDMNREAFKETSVLFGIDKILELL